MKMNWQKEKDVEPYKQAIEECIEKGILADYLKRKGSEVVNMLTAKYREAKHMMREEKREN